MTRRRLGVWTGFGVVATIATLMVASETALAHAAGLRDASASTVEVPTWLFLTTGGGAVGASFLLASFVTDRAFIERIHDWGVPLTEGGTRAPVLLGRAIGLVGFAAVLGIGFAAPTLGLTTPQTNLAILLVWVGWWAGLAMTTYLVGNTWRALNPLDTIALVLPSLNRRYPSRAGAWPSVVGLLALVAIAPFGAEGESRTETSQAGVFSGKPINWNSGKTTQALITKQNLN